MTSESCPTARIVFTIAMSLAVLVSAPRAKAEPPTDPKDIKVMVKENEISLQGQKLTFPSELDQIVKLLGKPSRMVDDVFQYHIWDEFGIAAKQNPFRKEKTTIGLRLVLKPTDDKQSSKKAFVGKLTVEGSAIDADTDMAKLGKPFEQLGELAIWNIPKQKAGVLFQTRDIKGKGIDVFLYERPTER
jgi:hypothetical protein